MTKQELQIILGKNLNKARIERRMTREELAEKVGISTTFCANLECGNKMMSVETLFRLTDALCISADSLLFGENKDEKCKSIDMLLRDQSLENIAFIEKLVRLCVNDLPHENKTEEGVTGQDECGTE